MNFVEKYIFARFGFPRKLLTDNPHAFKSVDRVHFYERYSIISKHSTPHYPQGNGLAKSTDKNLVNRIKKLLFEKKRTGDTRLKYALWADRVSTKKAIGASPFQLVYGIDAIFPIQLGMPVLKFL